MKNEKGITLSSLVISIIVILILASISIYSGTSTVRYTNYNKAKAEIQTIHAQVCKWHDKFLKNDSANNTENETDNVLDYGEKISDVETNDEIRQAIEDTFGGAGVNDENLQDNYRFFSEQYLKDTLGLDASFDYLVDIIHRDVILVGGVYYNGKSYFTLDDFGITNVDEYNVDKITFNLESGKIKEIVISDVKIHLSNNTTTDISKFTVEYMKKDDENSNWIDVTKNVVKFEDGEENNKTTKYKFSVDSFGVYNVRVRTTDKKLESFPVIIAIEEPRAIFKTGQEVNAKMKQLAGIEGATCETEDTNIREIKRATEISDANKIDSNIVSTSDSNTPIYMWYDNGIIYFYAEDILPNLNEDSSEMFESMSSVTSLDLSKFDSSNVTNMKKMFYNCKALISINLENFNTPEVTNMESMFEECSKLTNLDVSKFDTSKVNNMRWMFYKCNSLTTLDVSHFNTSNVTNMRGIFGSCSALTNLDVSKFDTSNVIEMTNMFNKCSSLTNLDVSKFITSKVTSMQSMFYMCSELTNLDVSKFDTSKVTNMESMFDQCSKLTRLDVSKFITSNVTNMQSMFYMCSELTNLDVSKFDTSKVTNMQSMFEECISINNIDVSGFITENVTNIKWMFYNCKSLTSLDLSNFDTAKVTDMLDMFGNCERLATIYASNKFITNNFKQGVYVDQDGNEKVSTNMFLNCTKLVGGSGTTFSGTKIDKAYAHIDGGTSNPGYFTAK